MSNVNITTSQRFGRTCASSGSSWEPIMGYSRAVRSGNVIAVTGTVGVESDGSFDPHIGRQTERCLEIIVAAIHALDAKLEHVIRTRIYTTRIDLWKDIAKVHGQIFGEIRPCTTLVGVAKLIDDAALIEIEVDAVLP